MVTLKVRRKLRLQGIQFVAPRMRGSGLKRVEEFNKAVILRHICNLFAQAGSLWGGFVNISLLCVNENSFIQKRTLAIMPENYRYTFTK
jgi:hypothetical protein